MDWTLGSRLTPGATEIGQFGDGLGIFAQEPFFVDGCLRQPQEETIPNL